jgi:hypothetical protein
MKVQLVIASEEVLLKERRYKGIQYSATDRKQLPFPDLIAIVLSTVASASPVFLKVLRQRS